MGINDNPEITETSELADQAGQTAESQQLEQLKQERDSLQDRLLRKQAEFENYKKRVERERSEFIQYASAELMKELLHALDSFDMAIHKGGGSSNNPGYDIELGTGSWRINVADGTTIAGAAFTSTPLLGEWVHLAAVRDAATGQLIAYTNGVRRMAVAGPTGSISGMAGLRFGLAGANNHPFQGRLDDVRIYDRALSADEIAALHAGR